MSRNLDDPKLRIWKTIPREHLQQFKLECLRAINEHDIKQEEIASVCGVNPSTVTRWFDVDGDLQFPAALIPCLNTERLLPLATELMQFAANHLGLIITRKIRVTGSLNASIQDETLDIVEHVGKLAEIAKKEVQSDPMSLRNGKLRLVKIIEAAQHGLSEMEEMERRS